MADPQDARQTPGPNREVPDLEDPPAKKKPAGERTDRATDVPDDAPAPADGPPPDADAPASAPVSTATPVRTEHGLVEDPNADAAPAAGGGTAPAATDPGRRTSPVLWVALAAVLIGAGVVAWALFWPTQETEEYVIPNDPTAAGAADEPRRR